MGEDPHGFQFGDACNVCVGVIFGEGRTPAYLAVQFSGIEKVWPAAPDPIVNHRFVCIETAHCFWAVTTYVGLWFCLVVIDLFDIDGGTTISAKFTLIGDYFFFFKDPSPCIISGESELPDMGDPAKDAYSGSSCRVNWGSTINESAWLGSLKKKK